MSAMDDVGKVLHHLKKHAGLGRPFGPSSGATLLSILEVEIYFEYVEARVCQDGGREARATPPPIRGGSSRSECAERPVPGELT